MSPLVARWLVASRLLGGESDWIPSTGNPESKACNSESKTVLDYLTRSDVYLTTTGDCLAFNMNKILSYSGSDCQRNCTSLPSDLSNLGQ